MNKHHNMKSLIIFNQFYKSHYKPINKTESKGAVSFVIDLFVFLKKCKYSLLPKLNHFVFHY